MKSVRWMVSYILVAVLGLWLAFAVSMKFMAPARSQGAAPDSGELPAEFMKEIDATQVPAVKKDEPVQAPPGKNTAAEAKPAPQPTATPAATPVEVPPPPASGASGAETPVGDGATAVSSPAQSFIPSDGYTYDPTGKRDPFKPFKTMRQAFVDKTKRTDSIEPLQRWELDRLQVVGILWDVRKPRAMVRDPDGVVYTVLKNSKIGRSEGIVAAIREGEVVVIETKYEDGNPVQEPRVLELKK